jgi:hypothetical protein
MSLLAYSGRRLIGALLVLLVLILLTQFAVYHITEPPGYVGRGGAATSWPRFLFPSLRFQPALAHEWNAAAVQVGSGLVVVLGVGAAWRLWKRRAT